jgi:DNA-binding protein Fis
MNYDPIEERVRNVLETYTFEELLEYNDTELYEMVLRLVVDGVLTLPDVEPL